MTLNFNCSILVFFRNTIWFDFLRIDTIWESARERQGSAQLQTVNMEASWPPPWVRTAGWQSSPCPNSWHSYLLRLASRWACPSLSALVKRVLQVLYFRSKLFPRANWPPVDPGNCRKVKGLSCPQENWCQSLEKHPGGMNLETRALTIISDTWVRNDLSVWKVRIPWRPAENRKETIGVGSSPFYFSLSLFSLSGSHQADLCSKRLHGMYVCKQPYPQRLTNTSKKGRPIDLHHSPHKLPHVNIYWHFL